MRVHLRPRQQKLLDRGYPWTFRDQIARVEGSPAAGDVVHLIDAAGRDRGLGFYHPESIIAVRFLTRDPQATIDAAFFERRLSRALELRRSSFGDSSHCRLAFSESDGLPGTVVDRLGNVLVFSILSAGMERRREQLLDTLEQLLAPAAIVERNDHWLRAKDGLEERTGVVRGKLPTTSSSRRRGFASASIPCTAPRRASSSTSACTAWRCAALRATGASSTCSAPTAGSASTPPVPEPAPSICSTSRRPPSSELDTTPASAASTA